jgi:hypothetical protein
LFERIKKYIKQVSTLELKALQALYEYNKQDKKQKKARERGSQPTKQGSERITLLGVDLVAGRLALNNQRHEHLLLVSQ